ncbi:MAG TPA: hypothetical protein VMJ65_30365 [Solirubrobacteraceae bacterium]|nr:hypothetical protein [Solirubrobacteraceae bacterium]
MAAAGFRTMHAPRVYAVAGPAYGGAVLALYAQVGVGERALGVLTWLVLLCALWPLPALVRAQALGVVAFATGGEVAGSVVWGIYHYRTRDLPLFVPPGHGLVYLTGLAVARIVGERRIVWAAAVGSVGWGLAGLTLLPRLDVAGGVGVAVLGAFLWRSRARATYAGVFFVVAALELYGTSIGAWHWTKTLPGLGITDGNPPSGAASGYVGFDVMAMLVAPTLVYAAAQLKPKRAPRREPRPPEPVTCIARNRGSRQVRWRDWRSWTHD